MKMTGDMVSAPVPPSKQTIVEPAAVGSVDQQQTIRRQFLENSLQGSSRIPQVFDELAHQDQIVAVVAQGAQISFSVALDRDDIGRLGGCHRVLVKLQVNANRFNICPKNLLDF